MKTLILSNVSSAAGRFNIALAVTLLISACGGTDGAASSANKTAALVATSAATPAEAAANTNATATANAAILLAQTPPSAKTLAVVTPLVAPAAAPTVAFSVGTEVVAYSRTAEDGSVRELPTKIYYPATAAGSGAPVAAGKFPLILFSHGKDGTYDTYPGPIGKLVAAGFIVAAPEYPHTKKGAVYIFNDAWLGRQSQDASQVITKVLARSETTGDKFYGHIDAAPGVGAAGHSLGGFTTDGLLSLKRDPRITTAVRYAGESIGKATGTPVKVLFQHGDADDILSYSEAHGNYDAVPASWPKAFLTHLNGDHWRYLWPDGVTYAQTTNTSVDWFRWGLYNDWAAYSRLKADATLDGKTKWESANLINMQIEAESYVRMGGAVKIEECAEGGQNVTGIDSNDWMWFDVTVPVAGSYNVEYRVASAKAGGVLLLKKPNAEIYGSVNVPQTGGAQSWVSVSHKVTLVAGKQKIAVRAQTGGFNLNWFKITQ